MRALAALALAGCLSQPSPKTHDLMWQRRDASQPGPMQSPRLAYDTDRRQVIMYSGSSMDVPGGSVWAYDGAAGVWSEICANGPSARFAPGFAYDSTRGVIVVAGGMSTETTNSTFYDDVHECKRGSPDTWSNGVALPEKTGAAAMIAAGDELFLIGGVTPTSVTSAVYSFADGTWTQHTSLPSVVASFGMAATYDDDHQRLLVEADGTVGGGGPGDSLFATPLANVNWGTFCNGCSGAVHIGGTIVHVSGLDETFVIAIRDTATNKEIGGTWQLVGDELVHVDTNPPMRDGTGAIYDPSRDVIVLYGGNGDPCVVGQNHDCAETWELTP